MKKIITMLTGLALVSVFAGHVFAAKPAGNTAGAANVPWNLSASVMPVPPYGSLDIPGSNTASKLIVNQPMGTTEVAITGIMNGLTPNTTYTVYPSNAWTSHQVWDVTGSWVLAVNNGAYTHDYTFTMTSLPDGTFTGVGGYPAGSAPDYIFDEVVINGTITGDTINYTAVYYTNGVPVNYSYDATGTIDNLGHFVSGTGTAGVSEWQSISGLATKKSVGNGWPGLFGNLGTFTFTTDSLGSATWHLNVKDSNLPVGTAPYGMSIWINGGGATILISDPFFVAK